MITIKGDSAYDGSYLDNTGSYSKPFEETFSGGISWDTSSWDTSSWAGIAQTVFDKYNVARYNDKTLIDLINGASGSCSTDLTDYYTKTEIDALFDEAPESVYTIYNGENTPTYNSLVAINEYGRLPELDARNLKHIMLDNIYGLSTNESVSKFLNGLGHYSSINYNDIINKPANIVSGYRVDTSTISGDGSKIPNNTAIQNYLYNNYLNKSYNLYDLTNKPQARDHLGLGYAATRDVKSNKYSPTTELDELPTWETVKYYVDAQIAASSGDGGDVTIEGASHFNDLGGVGNLPGFTNWYLNGEGNFTPITVSGNIQSDWNESVTSSPSYIKHKPSIPDFDLETSGETEWDGSSDVPTCNAVYEAIQRYSTVFEYGVDTVSLSTEERLCTSAAVIAYGNRYWRNTNSEWEIVSEYIQPSGSSYVSVGVIPASNYALKVKDKRIIFEDLPTSDPGYSNQLWNDSGTLKVSAG